MAHVSLLVSSHQVAYGSRQGRLFVSARIIGFHANLFGHKTKFFLLWEDVEDIQIVPPTFSSMGSPIIVVTLRQGRGVDAKHGAKTQDEQGRLKFHFQSFVSFNVANRYTISKKVYSFKLITVVESKNILRLI